MTRHEKIGAIILLAWVIFWLCFFGYLIAVMPDYGTGVLH
jgi:hypothetical protein